MTPFSIYKASAGSGKTFTICKAFVKEMLCDETAYRHMLAVTFTNKATNEMKQRIIANLSEIASGRSEALQQALMEDFRKEQQSGAVLPAHISRLLDLSDAGARQAMAERAGRLIQQLLHDYGRLSVMTIDSFFQRIIRAFAMETGLSATFELQLDSRPTMEQAVDLFMSDLRHGTEAFRWICDMMEERMRSGTSWNCRQTLVDAGIQMLQEAAQVIPGEVMNRLTDQRTVRQYREQVEGIRHRFESAMRQDARTALDIMQSHHLDTEDFKGKSRGFSTYFAKVLTRKEYEPGQNACLACNCPEEWYTDKKKSAEVKAAYHDGMNECLCRMVNRWKQEHETFNTACIILKNMSQMGLVADLNNALQRICREEDLFLNSRSNAWIKQIIDGSDAPFIYERTGNRYQHFMIDEMQDTSHMQWDNLLPLLRNGLAQDAASWTVGDVKQAIYRFRNGDWRIMAQQIGRDIPGAKEKRLEFNYRSAPEVIQFNNLFFSKFSEIMTSILSTEAQQEDFRRIYADVCQRIPDGARQKHGFVSLRFHDAGRTSGKDWQEDALTALPGQIMQLERKGFKASDIAVLVRGKKEAVRTAQYMLAWCASHPEEGRQYVFDMLYNEALYIDDSGLVQWILEALTYLVSPDLDINREALAVHSRQILDRHPDEMAELLQVWSAENRGVSVYQAVVNLADMADLYRYADDAPYLQAFLDFLFTYCRTRPVDTAAFLTYWEEHQHTEHLKMPETQDAIRLMTIHKSKGLEFGAVLMPFVDWEMCKFRNTDMAWLETAGTPFDAMPVVHVALNSKGIRQSSFAAQVSQETFMSFIDSVNLLYVAFTRARDVLIADIPCNGPAPDGDNGTGMPELAQLIWRTCSALAPACGWTPLDVPPESGISGWCSGTFEGLDQRHPAAEAPGFPLSGLHRPSHGTPAVTRIRQAADFFEPLVPSAATRGVVLHELFSRIRTLDDLPQRLEELADEGIIADSDKEMLARFVQEVCNDREVQSWFSADVSVRTEADLLLPDGTRLRPDRVTITSECIKVIDYKFGTQQLPQHQQQVRGYMQTLKEMGHGHVEGFLWYVSLGRIVKVVRA